MPPFVRRNDVEPRRQAEPDAADERSHAAGKTSHASSALIRFNEAAFSETDVLSRDVICNNGDVASIFFAAPARQLIAGTERCWGGR
jgi:hypothetical protein